MSDYRKVYVRLSMYYHIFSIYIQWRLHIYEMSNLQMLVFVAEWIWKHIRKSLVIVIQRDYKHDLCEGQHPTFDQFFTEFIQLRNVNFRLSKSVFQIKYVLSYILNLLLMEIGYVRKVRFTNVSVCRRINVKCTKKSKSIIWLCVLSIRANRVKL